MTINVTGDIIGILSLLEIDGPRVRITQQLDRPTYLDVNKVLEACGGKWNRSLKVHLFDDDPQDLIDTVINTGKCFRKKQDFDQFDSPPSVVETVIREASIKPGMTVLEPQAGLGYLATEAAHVGGSVDCYELDPQRIAILEQNPLLKHVWQGDFMEAAPRRDYDRIVMNPPFSKQQDIDHVLHALKFLAPGGRLVSVMSAGVSFRSNMKTVRFREEIADLNAIIYPLPADSFKQSGTSVNTCLLVVQA